MRRWEELADTRCLVGGVDVCFGGTCREEDGLQFCQCDSGYGPDMFTFHMANCVVPRYAFEVYFVMFSVLWTGVLVSFVRRVRRSVLDARMRRISQLTLMYHMALGCVVVGYLMQGGMFEISAVFTFTTYTLWGTILTHMLVLVLNVSHERSSILDFERNMFGALRLAIMFIIGPSLASVLTMRSQYADAFGYVAHVCFNIALLSATLFARKQTNEFVMTLDVGMRFAEGRSLLKLQSLRARVTTIQYYMGVLIGAFTVMSMPMLLRFVLGTLPFYYVALAPIVVFANMVTSGMGQLLEDNATELKVDRNGIDLIADPDSTGAEPSSSDSRHSGYIVGAYKVNTSKRRHRRRV